MVSTISKKNVHWFQKCSPIQENCLQKCLQLGIFFGNSIECSWIQKIVLDFKKYSKICKSIYEIEKCSWFQICAWV